MQNAQEKICLENKIKSINNQFNLYIKKNSKETDLGNVTSIDKIIFEQQQKNYK